MLMNKCKKNIIYRLTDGKSVADWCRNYNVPYSSVTVMLNKGYLVDDACKLAKEAHERRLQRKILMYNGKSLRSTVSGGAYTAIKRKIKLTGCDIETAVRVYYHNKQHNGKYITVNDIKKDLENVDNRV